MSHWVLVKDAIGTVLQILTIIVLFVTWRAILRQANAAEKLTTATDQQIKTGQEQAKAAREQVEVARRQIAEALRPILVLRYLPNPSNERLEIAIRNDGGGVALDVWWSYGKFVDSHMVLERHRIERGIIPPTREAKFTTNEVRAVRESIVIVYESLARIASATTVQWDGNYWVSDYIQDASEWARTLLGKPLGPT
jgi:hypothetical protein